MTPVAIAGVGCISALGASLDSCMQALYAGERNYGLPSRFPIHCETSQPVFPDPAAHLPDDPHCHRTGHGPGASGAR